MINQPAHILFVEDEISFSSLVSNTLREEHGHEVDLAETGEEAIEKLKLNQYDVVFLDYRLPGISGLDVLRWIKENQMQLPVIMLTAAGSETVAVEAMKLGAYDYIRKERFELDHLPVMVYNAREWTILRRENERMERELREREKQEAVVKMFQDTVRTLSHYINNSLAALKLRAQVYERKLQKGIVGSQIEEFQVVVREVLRDAKIIEAVMKSLVNLSDVVYTKYSGDQEMLDIRNELQRALAELE
ncbi:MAG: response regulator [Bacteroidota bacterium]